MEENIPDSDALFCDMDAFTRPCVISVTGAGGKTSTVFWLARLFHRAGRRVLITTTTHMYLPRGEYPVVLCREPGRLPASTISSSLVACFSGWNAGTGKAKGFSPEIVDALAARPETDVLLVEADGAKGLAIKAPDEHEPCIPESSCCVIAVTGGQMLGQKVSQDNVHRWSCFSRITGLKPDETLDTGALIRLIQHPQGAFKHTPSASRRVWLINQFSHCENPDESELTRLITNGVVDAVWLGAVQENPPITRRFVR